MYLSQLIANNASRLVSKKMAPWTWRRNPESLMVWQFSRMFSKHSGMLFSNMFKLYKLSRATMLLYREARTIFPVVQIIVSKERNPTRSLGVTSSLNWRKGNGYPSSILAWRIPWTETTVHGLAKSRIQLSD